MKHSVGNRDRVAVAVVKVVVVVVVTVEEGMVVIISSGEVTEAEAVAVVGRCCRPLSNATRSYKYRRENS